MSTRPLQFSLAALFGWVTFAALMCWMATLSTFTLILAIAIVKHVFVAWLCMWYMGPHRGSTKTTSRHSDLSRPVKTDRLRTQQTSSPTIEPMHRRPAQPAVLSAGPPPA